MDMGNAQEDIEFYFSQKLAGSISEKDLLYIDTLIDRDIAVREHWLEYCSHFEAQDIQSGFSWLDRPEGWKPITKTELEGTLTHKRPFIQSNRLRMLKYAAAIVVTVSLSYGFYSYFGTPKTNVEKRIAHLGIDNEIYLDLADGRKFNLRGKSGSFYAGGIHFTFANGQLSFKLSPGASAVGGVNKLSVPVGKNYSIQLEDGSTIMLNAASTVQFPARFQGSKREIWVSGEAYLSIAQDVKRPFTVHTQGGEVQVLGTEFNVNTYDPQRTKVVLISGSVRLVTGKTKVKLRPGTTGITTPDQQIETEVSDPNQAVSWKSGRYFFQNADLHEIKEVLERWYGITVDIDHMNLPTEKFTGAIDRKDSINVFLDNLTSVTTIKYQISHNRVQFK